MMKRTIQSLKKDVMSIFIYHIEMNQEGRGASFLIT